MRRGKTRTLGVMFTAATQYRYVAEAVWLPTYLSVAALLVALINNNTAAAVAVVVALTGCRLLLELVYRIVLGDARLQWRVGVIAIVSQILVWGFVWTWYAQRGAI
jgi:hypothetical protein